MTDVRALAKELHEQIEEQFNLDKSLSERDHLSLLTTLHADRLHADDLATVEEALEYTDALHLKLHAFLPVLLDALEREPVTAEEVEKAQLATVCDARTSPQEYAKLLAAALNRAKHGERS